MYNIYVCTVNTMYPDPYLQHRQSMNNQQHRVDFHLRSDEPDMPDRGQTGAADPEPNSQQFQFVLHTLYTRS